ncbi:acyl carrier protein [Streptomyces sp. BJ20]|uniref:acyl carrier protein n=1 Tax=Streptomyces sp. BJ20 TaxID=2930049 RepID=UPI001FD1BA02|nr:acyl carrier protein [Streptomyces sp. BJ20]
MSSQPQTASPPDPDGPAAGILDGLTAVLADTLHVEPGRIDPRQPFQVLGVDSIFAAEFVAALNTRFGTAVTAAALHDHPAPADLARHLASAGVQGPAGQPGTSAGLTVSGADAVLDELRGHLAATVHCDPAALDPQTAFPLLGLDSVMAAEFVAAVNRAYGLSERPVTLYDHPSLAAMAQYIAGAAPGAPGAAGSLARADAAPDPIRSEVRSDLTKDEVNALLDAVRDDMLTVDEAVTLLTPRPL